MKRLKADVSHRIRRRPSVLQAAWFRVLLGSSMAIALGFLIGPTLAGWFRTDLPRGVRLFAPWSASAPEPLPAAKPQGARLSDSAPPGAGLRFPAPPAQSPTAPSSTGASAVYRIQLGAFLDHMNADRLVARLTNEGFGAVTTVSEQGRTLYRVIATSSAKPAEGTGTLGTEALAERLRQLGFSVEVAEGGLAATGPLPLETATETSERLRDQGIPVRLQEETSAGSFRVVRLGPYATSEEAERARRELAARGFEGIVLRER